MAVSHGNEKFARDVSAENVSAEVAISLPD